MSTEEMSAEDAAIRIATLLSTVMNVGVILQDENALRASAPVELRATLLWIVDEMCWLASSVTRGSMAGISWPADAQARIERLRTVAESWDPVDPPPAEVTSRARDCLGILQPSAETPHRSPRGG